MKGSDKKRKFNKIVNGIKNVKIQGAQNIAKKALYAYSLIPTKKSKKRLLSIRPTEPMMRNVFKHLKKSSFEEVMTFFDKSQQKINQYCLKLIKNKDIIFAHCHSSTVNEALIYAKKKGKKFEVYNTETRPLYQGRKTARELSKAGIKVSHFVDSAAMIALTEKQETKKVNKVFLGADALLNNGAINKVGSGMIAKIAYENKIPVYIISNSWKYSKTKVKMEKRNLKEIWLKKPGNVKINNPAFEFVPRKYIRGIVSEKGYTTYDKFIKEIEK